MRCAPIQNDSSPHTIVHGFGGRFKLRDHTAHHGPIPDQASDGLTLNFTQQSLILIKDPGDIRQKQEARGAQCAGQGPCRRIRIDVITRTIVSHADRSDDGNKVVIGSGKGRQ